MKSKKMIALMWLLTAVSAAMVAVAWPQLPGQVPTNWGFDGTVSYSSRATLWMMPGMAAGISLLLQFLPRIDPRRKNYEKFQGAYDISGPLMAGFMLLMTGIILVETFRPGTLNVGRTVTVLVGVLFVVLGCIIGKVKRNWFMGIRTPWAMDDPDVWNKTQRMGGWVFFLSGLVTIPLALLAPEMVFFVALMATIGVGMLLTTFMSWWWYRQRHGDGPSDS